MTMRRVATTALLLLLCSIAAPGVASDGSDTDALDELEGTWQATNSREDARARIDEQIDAVVAEMSFIKRPFARRRLTKVTRPCQTMTFQRMENARVEVHCTTRKAAVAPLDGTPVRWTDEDGEAFTLTQKVHDDRIVQTFEGEDGTRRNVYRPDGDTMILDATLTSDQLPEPLTFRRTFTRK
jgi:hypothetical protein